MLWSIAIIFALLWALGLATSHTFGGFIHALVAAAVVLVLVRIIKGPARRRSNGKRRYFKRGIQ
jgi:uncharacterized membrane protein YeaQ/YmgE (transglycosylase-associated protein family)